MDLLKIRPSLHLFKQIFKAGLELQEDDHRKELACFTKEKGRRYGH